ncbi:MAG: 50S ribosomal protein L15e [Nanoarchaeota archaeon]|nr:50S ribosomal protein L15e [Nanoarchaeota archaeon]
MTQGMYHYLREAWKKPGRELLHEKLIKWRAGDSVEKVEKPLRLDRARSLGYKAKKGIFVVRVRVIRGGRRRIRKGVKGRKSRKQTVRKMLKMNYKWVAEIRAARKYENMEVLNSYWVGRDGKYYFFEVIMVDPNMPEIKSDRTLKWITNRANSKRAERGLTSAGKKSRGLRSKSPELKVRPSLRSWNRQGK